MSVTPPVVDRLDTRSLERREVLRTFVTSAEVVRADAGHAILRTVARASDRLTEPSTEPGGFGGAPPTANVPAEGDVIEGTLRIDLLQGEAFRVRYTEGPEVPTNNTPMVTGSVECTPAELLDNGHGLHYRIGDHELEVELEPLLIRAIDGSGRVVCEIGGREKNEWSNWDSFNTGICRTVPDSHPLAVECFSLRPGEAVYGFGETFMGLDKTGQTIDLNMVEPLGVSTPRSYKNIPFFVTTNGYGVFLNHSSRITAWIGSLSAVDVQVAVEDEFLDYTVMLGDIKTVLNRYTDLTGKAAVPPPWSFGYWQSKISYKSAEEALGVVRSLRAAEIPVDVLHLDTFWFSRDWYCDLEFDPERFPDPAHFLAEMDELGVHVSLWQLPYIPDGTQLFDDLAAVDGFVKTTDGDVYDIGICYTPNWDGTNRVGCIDFTNPAAVNVYQSHLRRLFRLGVAAIKVDFGEQAPLDGVYHDGTPGHQAHNLYPLLYNQAVADVTVEATGANIIWARSAWAGSQRYPLHWGGDSSANWHNLPPQIAGGLSLGLSGFSFWSQDIGGFLGQPDSELLIRWMQAGLFLSHARIHGFGDRELTAFDDRTVEICRNYLQLRYRLLPYLLATANESAEQGLPMARALVVEHQDDPTTWPIADQWLLGRDLLVAPILDSTGRRRVYLPSGTWTDWWSGEPLDGNQWIDVYVDLETLPLWIREGALIGLGPDQLYVGEKPADQLTLRVSPFTRDGNTSATFVIDGRPVTCDYTCIDGAHVIVLSGDGLKVTLDVVGPHPPHIEVRSHA